MSESTMEYEKITPELRAFILKGLHKNVRGDISSDLSGDISGLRGYISSGLSGDISSGLRGDIAAGKWPGLTIDIPSPEEIARLDAVREVFLARPDRLKMSYWHSDGWTPDHTPEEEYSCGSAHCIAGWLQALSPDPEIRAMEPVAAGRLLSPSAAGMFYVSDATAFKWLETRAYDFAGKNS